MHEWSSYLLQLGRPTRTTPCYLALLEQCKSSFQQRFWYAEGGYLYDVVDGPGGNDTALRPNQLLAFSLRYPVLAAPYRQHVFEHVTQHLLTPYGLRTLAPVDLAYHGHLGTHSEEQQQALHQGSVWPWLLGPYIDAMLAINYRTEKQEATSERLLREYLWRRGLRLLEPLKEYPYEDMLGMGPAVVDGEAPHYPGQMATTMLNVAELLRIYNTLAHMHTTQPEQSLSY
jgi:hypothetical protein